MTITNPTARVSYDGDGSTTAFAVPFRFLEDGHLSVVLLAADGSASVLSDQAVPPYALTGADQDAGGTLTLNTAPAAGETLLISRATPVSQEVKYVEGARFPAATHERALDKLTMQQQEVAQGLADAVRKPLTDPDVNMELPSAAERANKSLVFGPDGAVNAAAPADPGAVLFSSYGEGLVQQSNAANARALLGVASQAETQSVLNALTAAFTVGHVRPRMSADDLSPSWIPLDGRTIGKAGTSGSAGHVAHDELGALFDQAKGFAPNTGSEDFATGDVVFLPDLRGRTVIGAGQGTGLTLRTLGGVLGEEAHLLTADESGLPQHSHTYTRTTGPTQVAGGAGANVQAATVNTGNAGPTDAAQPHNTMQPSWAGQYEVWSGILPDGVSVNLGQLGIQWIPGGWALSTEYKRNDALRHTASTPPRAYLCLQDHTSAADNEPGTGASWASVWSEMVLDGLQGVPGGVASWTGPWDPLRTYAVNEAVQHNGSSYVATAVSTDKEPGVAADWASFWDLQAAKGDPGDMDRTVYDTDLDGIVDAAEALSDGVTTKAFADVRTEAEVAGTVREYSKRQQVGYVTVASGATVTLDYTDDQNHAIELAHDIAFQAPTIPAGAVGATVKLRLKQPSAGGPHIPTFHTTWNFGAQGAPSFSSAADAYDLIVGEIVSTTQISATWIKGTA